MRDHIERHVYQPLRVAFGLVPIAAGLDKFCNLLADWKAYVSPLVADILPPATLMPVVGVVEIAVGLMVLTRWTKWGARLAAGWLVLIALDLLAMGRFDVAVRDLVMAVAAYGLAHLAAVHGTDRIEARSSEVPSGSARIAR